MDALLVVEDDGVIRQMLTEVLEDEGYQVLGARNGREALSLLRAAATVPFVILLDMRMPVMNGWQFLTHTQQDPTLATIPVIITSGEGQLEQTVGMRPHMCHMEKPLDITVLVETIATYHPVQRM